MKNDAWKVYPTDGGSTKKLVLEIACELYGTSLHWCLLV